MILPKGVELIHIFVFTDRSKKWFTYFMNPFLRALFNQNMKDFIKESHLFSGLKVTFALAGFLHRLPRRLNLSVAVIAMLKLTRTKYFCFSQGTCFGEEKSRGSACEGNDC